MPHEAMPDGSGFRFLVEEVANPNNLQLEVFGPIAKFHIIVILGSIFRLKTFENPQRVLHVVVKVFTDEVLKSFYAVVKDSDVVDSSKMDNR